MFKYINQVLSNRRSSIHNSAKNFADNVVTATTSNNQGIIGSYVKDLSTVNTKIDSQARGIVDNHINSLIKELGKAPHAKIPINDGYRVMFMNKSAKGEITYTNYMVDKIGYRLYNFND